MNNHVNQANVNGHENAAAPAVPQPQPQAEVGAAGEGAALGFQPYIRPSYFTLRVSRLNILTLEMCNLYVCEREGLLLSHLYSILSPSDV